MSIATEIQRLQNAKNAIKASIENKGVEVDEDATLDEYPSLIDAIESGGGEQFWGGGKNPTLVRRFEREFNLAEDTSYLSITPSTSSTQILAYFNLLEETLDVNNYDYVVVEKVQVDLAYLDNVPSSYNYVKRTLSEEIYNVGEMYYNSNVTKAKNVKKLLGIEGQIYNKANVGNSYSGTTMYGISKSSSIAPSFNASTSLLKVNGHAIKVQAQQSYMQVEAFNYLDTTNTIIKYEVEIYRVDKCSAVEITALNDFVGNLNRDIV